MGLNDRTSTFACQRSLSVLRGLFAESPCPKIAARNRALAEDEKFMARKLHKRPVVTAIWKLRILSCL